jgi:hypothetical protein
MTIRTRMKAVAVGAIAVGVAVLAGGCSLRDATVDGVFGGISDTVATVVANILLATVAPGAP